MLGLGASLLLGLAGPHVRCHAQARPPPPPAQLSYAIDVKLDTSRHTLSGRERIHFENTSRAPLNELYFHLYLNAFRDGESVFMREGGSELRQRPIGRAGFIVISELRTAQGVDLSGAIDLELVPADRTQARVQLPSPLQPGEALELDLSFHAQLPELVARAGYAGEFHMLGQWFPKLAKLEDDGQFASFPYHGFGEFYADFADYTLDIELPARFTVASSGACEHSSVQDGVRRERYRAAHVHDVAWAAYPYFEQRTARVGNVQLLLYAPHGYGAALERQAAVLSEALPFFERHYGPYVYPTLSVVIPPSDGAGAAGMEYPTLFVSAGPAWALGPAWPDPLHDVVCVHELAHQWFSGMIASHEVAHPMLDEGLAEWSSLDFLREFYAHPRFHTAGLPLPEGPFDLLRAWSLARVRSAPSSLLSADAYTAKTLGPSVYARPALALSRLGERTGRERLRAAIGHYARAQRFRHPTPDALFAALDATLGEGYGTRVLAKALESEQASAEQLAASGEAAPAPSGMRFLPELFNLAFSVLRGLGP